jgi:pimeloyl-ACP methyl ester carboxylesterase
MPTLKTTASPATELYYEDRGEGQAIVLVHGWPLSGAMWESQVNALVDAGFRCVTYDRRGFGRSGRPTGGYDYDTFASDLNDVVTAIDLHSFTLAGFSMGGGEVARYIGKYGTERVRKAVLISAVPPFLLKTDDNPDGVDGKVFDGMIDAIKKDRVNFLAGFLQQFFNRDPGSSTPSDDVIAYSKSIAWVASPVGTQQCVVAFGTTDFRADLAKFDLPTLVIHGDQDRIVPFEVSGKRSAALIKGARLEVIKGAPHGLTATHGDRVTELLAGFLQETTERAAPRAYRAPDDTLRI